MLEQLAQQEWSNRIPEKINKPDSANVYFVT
jgi:hypothetical protein